MDPTTKDKLKTNAAASWKMLSVQWMAAVNGAGVAAIGTFAALSDAQQTALVAWVLSHLGFTASGLVVSFVVGWLLRIKPQGNLSPAVAAAKSADPLPAISLLPADGMNQPLPPVIPQQPDGTI